MAAEDFMITESNREAAKWALECNTEEWLHHCLIIYGPQGCGKTHLLTAWTEKNKARKISAGENIITELSALTEKNGKENTTKITALALDDANKITGQAHLEEWLKHIYDAAKNAGIYLLLTASSPPSTWGLSLKDIESRLKSCPAIEIKEPDDELMRGLLVKMFNDRQLMVDSEVIDYILPRIERTGTAARNAVRLLDQKALELRRKITIPFVSEFLFSQQSRIG